MDVLMPKRRPLPPSSQGEHEVEAELGVRHAQRTASLSPRRRSLERLRRPIEVMLKHLQPVLSTNATGRRGTMEARGPTKPMNAHVVGVDVSLRRSSQASNTSLSRGATCHANEGVLPAVTPSGRHARTRSIYSVRTSTVVQAVTPEAEEKAQLRMLRRHLKTKSVKMERVSKGEALAKAIHHNSISCAAGPSLKSLSLQMDTPPPSDGRSPPSMSLEKALRLAALTCRTAEKTNNGNEVGSSRKLHQGSKFGLYSVSEVLAVIRLFRVLDDDSSNTVTLNELQQLRPFLEKLGHHTVSTAFQTIDKDSDGHIRLSELLGCCFPHASALQIDEMLKLGQVDNLRQYFQNESKHPAALVSGLSDSVEPKNKDELHEIFRLYDKNGDGYISLEEMVEAVRVDDNTSEGEQVGRTRSPVECSTWRRSSGITRADMERFYAESDANADNLLDFDEFVDLMRELHLFE